MNKNAAILVAAISIVALIIGVFYVPTLLKESLPLETSVVFLDEEGNAIATSLTMDIHAGGVEVYSLQVKAKWTVDASNINPATFNAHVRVDLAVKCLLNTYEQLPSAHIDSSVMIQESYVEVHTWVLADLLSEYMTDAHKAAGWTIRIRSTLTPTAKDFDGVDVTPDPPTQDGTTVFADLIWVDTTATMTIIDFEVNRWLPLP